MKKFLLMLLWLMIIPVYGQPDNVEVAAERGDMEAQRFLAVSFLRGENGYPLNKEQSYKWCIRAAKQGDAVCQFIIGLAIYYSSGIGTKEEPGKWMCKAADNGHPDACMFWGNFLYNKDYDSKLRSVKYLKIAAENGISDSQVKYGLCLFQGIGCPPNYHEAFEWFQKAAEQGDASALFYMSICYEDGVGVRQNTMQALNLLKKSAEQGCGIAQAKLGDYYIEGNNIPCDKQQGFYWIKQSAEQGNAVGMYSLSRAYLLGNGTSINEAMALFWLEKSAESGCDIAQHVWADVIYDGKHGVAVNKEAAMNWWLKAAKQQCVYSYYRIGNCYLEASGTVQNIDSAYYWFEKAVKESEPFSDTYWDGIYGFYLIGLYYDKEIELPSYIKAKEYYQKAAELGLMLGYNNLAYLYARGGYGLVQDFQEAHRLIDIAIAKVQTGAPHMEDDWTLQNLLDSKGEFYLMANNYEAAISIYEEIQNTQGQKILDSPFYTMMQSYLQNGIDRADDILGPENENAFAIIIANETYKREEKVPFALNDGHTFREYCKRTLRIPDTNIKYVEDATGNDLRYVINWVQQIMDAYNGEAKVIFYYSGHGIPDEKSETAHLLPIDGFASDISTGYSLNDLYAALNKYPAQSVVCFLDACFSGSKRDGKMMQASSRGVAIKTKQTSPQGNIVVFSAAQGDETAYPLEDQKHGLFTYFLLKKLKESKGAVSLGELGDYITTEVKKKSITANGKMQTPSVTADNQLGDDWKNWTLK